MLNMCAKIALALVFAGSLSACQTDRERLNIGNASEITPPADMFPQYSDRQKYAGAIVSYNFKANRAALTEDPAKLFRTVAYFEYLVNELKQPGTFVTPDKVRDAIDARDDIRSFFDISPAETTQDVIDETFAMAKLLDAMGPRTAFEPTDVASRRSVIAQTKAKIDSLIKKIAEEDQKKRNAADG